MKHLRVKQLDPDKVVTRAAQSLLAESINKAMPGSSLRRAWDALGEGRRADVAMGALAARVCSVRLDAETLTDINSGADYAADTAVFSAVADAVDDIIQAAAATTKEAA